MMDYLEKRKKLVQVASAILAVLLAGMATGFIRGLWSSIGEVGQGAIFICAWFVFYIAFVWSNDLLQANEKRPVSKKELRRRARAFYDWIDSQGRR